MTIEEHKINFRQSKVREEREQEVRAEEILRRVLGPTFDEHTEWGLTGDTRNPYVKFKNHKTIVVIDQYAERTRFSVDGVQYYNFGEALIKAQYKNNWWNRATGKYKQ